MFGNAIQDYFVEGEILACGSVPKLGGLGACSPRKFLKLATSETVSNTYSIYVGKYSLEAHKILGEPGAPRLISRQPPLNIFFSKH